MNTTEILDQLNAYQSEHTDPTEANIWQDVILKLDDYDEAGTDAIDNGRNDAFMLDGGQIIQYSYAGYQWVIGLVPEGNE